MSAFPSIFYHLLPACRSRALALLALACSTTLLRADAPVVESDICVYGGTSGGVVAAVQAARMGKSVVVVEPGRHVGGMTSGGLGATDTGNISTIGGLSREFYRRVGQRYGLSETFRFEPHVAEEVLREMLAEYQVPVYHGQTLASVTMRGQQITELVTTDGTRFRARMFLDTTYEGDLLAAAGVSFAVGREATNTFGENLNGIRASTPAHQFALAVDPYVTPGNPASGLLPLVQAGDGGVPGQGDSRVQAYNFRMCLTQVETNRLPINPPPGYDPARYELLGRYIQARVNAGTTLTPGSFLNISTMPNGKTDMNNNGAISTDYIGMSYTYPTNTPAERAMIWKDHENYIRGFFTFLATDSRVPLTLRSNLQTWGLCRDEFQDTGGWPHQLYVREARRMLSDYLITQTDCDGLRVAQDSVGLASYNMDSHNCQRFVRFNSVTNEGDVQRAPSGPFPISYRAIVPKVGECSNLFATFCLSGTHIAFSSARMEPVFMITSQSAATAAALAIDDQVPVQQVSYAKLRLHLLAQGQSLQWGVTATTPTNSIVLDSEQTTNAVVVTGTWTVSTANTGYNGSNYLHDGNTNKGTRSVRYTPNLPTAGRYQVALRWPQNANRATNVPLTLTHAGGVTNLTLDQRNQGNAWILLGEFAFNAGTNGSLLLGNTGTDGYVIADGVMWSPVAESAVAQVDILATDALAAEDGPDSAVFTLLRTGDSLSALTVNYTLGGSATPGVDYPAGSGSLVIPPGLTQISLLVTPASDFLTEGDETVVFSLRPGSNYVTGYFTNAQIAIRDGGFGRWRTNQFTPGQLADPGQSGNTADPDADGQPNLMEYFLGTDPRGSNATPGLELVRGTNEWLLEWRRARAANELFLRVEHSPDLRQWAPARFTAQTPQPLDSNVVQRLRFNLGPDATNGVPAGFYRVAVSPTLLPLTTNEARFFFSFDSSPPGTNAFQNTVTALDGFYGTPTITRTGTVLADAGGATNYTDFTGVTWQGSGGASTPGHSLTFNNGSANNSLSLTFSTLGLRQVRLRMEIRSAAQTGGSAPVAFTSFTYDLGAGPQPVPGVNLSVLADNAFHEWTADLSALSALDNQRQVTLTWTVKTLAATPAESFRVDNLEVRAQPVGN